MLLIITQLLLAIDSLAFLVVFFYFKNLELATQGITPRSRPGVIRPNDFESRQRKFLFSEITSFLKNLFRLEDGFILRPIDLTKEAKNRIPLPGRIPRARADSEVNELSMANYKYFHLCSRENSAILLEVKVDSSSASPYSSPTHSPNGSSCIGRVNLSAFSLNLNLLDATEHENGTNPHHNPTEMGISTAETLVPINAYKLKAIMSDRRMPNWHCQ